MTARGCPAAPRGTTGPAVYVHGRVGAPEAGQQAHAYQVIVNENIAEAAAGGQRARQKRRNW